MLVLIIFAIAIMESIAQYFIKKYHEIPYLAYYLLSIFFYSIIVYLIHKSYDYASMGMTQILWSGASVVSILFVGSFFFGETIELNEMMGIIFILSGIIISQMKNFY